MLINIASGFILAIGQKISMKTLNLGGFWPRTKHIVSIHFRLRSYVKMFEGVAYEPR